MRKIKTDTPTQCMIYQNSAYSSKYVLDYFQTDIPKVLVSDSTTKLGLKNKHFSTKHMVIVERNFFTIFQIRSEWCQ